MSQWPPPTPETMMVSPGAPLSSRILGSPNRAPDGALPYYRSPSVADFQIERVAKQSPVPPRRVAAEAAYDDEYIFRDHVARLLAAKSRLFTVSGRIPLDPTHLVLFFRTKSGITHSLSFPVDVDYDTPPALDVLIAASRPHESLTDDGFPDRESLYYPLNLPITTTLEISNHPILEAVRNTLFPTLPTGHYLTTVRDKLEIITGGGRMATQPRTLRNDGRAATIIVTLPVRYRGGALVIRDADGIEEKFFGRGGKNGDIEWTAFLADCDYEVETVTKGCRITISYGVFLKTFGPSGLYPEPLITPSDHFLDLLSPVLNMSRGRRIAFYLAHDHNVNPSEVLAESLVPDLRGGDSLLYHAIKLYKLTPELHWTAGGYVWPVDRTVDMADLPPAAPNGVYRATAPPVRGAFGTYNDPDEEVVDNLRVRIEGSGAVPLAEADITVLTDWNAAALVGKARAPFVSGGELEKLVVNILLIAYVP